MCKCMIKKSENKYGGAHTRNNACEFELNSSLFVFTIWLKQSSKTECAHKMYGSNERSEEANCVCSTICNCIKWFAVWVRSSYMFHYLPSGRCKFRLIGGPVYWRFSTNIAHTMFSSFISPFALMVILIFTLPISNPNISAIYSLSHRNQWNYFFFGSIEWTE